MAIPLSSLGQLLPGDVVKLGAVVGGGEFDAHPARQARRLDSSYLGTSLIGSGLGPVLLEGLSVRLALDPGPDPDADGLLTMDEQRLGTDPSKPDTDGDALPDGWEAAHALDPLSAFRCEENGAVGDPDKDGFLNLAEFMAGTDPRDPKSVLSLAIQATGVNVCGFRGRAVVGKSYQIQTSENPWGEFANLSTPISRFARRQST